MGPLYLYKLQGDPEKGLNFTRLLVERGQIDPMLPDSQGQTILDCFWGDIATWKYLIRLQDQFVIDLSRTDSYGRTALQNQSMRFFGTTPMLIGALLGDGPISYEKATEVWIGRDGPETLLLGSARRLSIFYQRNEWLSGELAFVSDLVHAGADLHIQDGSGATPLDYLLASNLTFSWSRRLPEVNKELLLLNWVSCLYRSGVDLREYWHKEEGLHENGKLVPRVCYRRHIDRIFTVYYGVGYDDITVLVEDVYQDKNPLTHMPGGWDLEAEYAQKRGLKLIEGESPSAFWSITTAGFQYGDHSPERASCTIKVDVKESAF